MPPSPPILSSLLPTPPPSVKFTPSLPPSWSNCPVGWMAPCGFSQCPSKYWRLSPLSRHNAPLSPYPFSAEPLPPLPSDPPTTQYMPSIQSLWLAYLGVIGPGHSILHHQFHIGPGFSPGNSMNITQEKSLIQQIYSGQRTRQFLHEDQAIFYPTSVPY